MASTPDDRFEDEGGTCSACGARITSDLDRTFAFGADNLLCGSCAAARGGKYDAERDAWDPPPDLADLPDEAYGASPHEVRRRRR